MGKKIIFISIPIIIICLICTWIFDYFYNKNYNLENIVETNELYSYDISFDDNFLYSVQTNLAKTEVQVIQKNLNTNSIYSKIFIITPQEFRDIDYLNQKPKDLYHNVHQLFQNN